MNGVAALLTAVCVSVLASIGLAFSLGGLSPLAAGVSLGAGAVAGALQYAAYLRRRGPAQPRRKISGWEWGVIVVYILFSLRAFCWVVFWNDDKIQFLSPNNLGDLSLHLTYINNLASGVPFWPENPIFAGERIHYPLGVDLFNSLLKLAGLDVYRGLVWVGLASCLVTGIALYKWGRGFALAGFLFNGGLAGFEFLSAFHLKDYQEDLAWKSIPLAMFVTQRGLLYAIPAGLALLWSWRERFFPDPGNKDEQPLPFWTEVLLYSTMPLFHVHAFIFLSFLLGCWMVLFIVRSFTETGSNSAIPLLKLIACSVVPATVLLAFITGSFKSGHMIHIVGSAISTSRSWDWEYGEQPQFAAWAAEKHLGPLATSVLGHTANWVVNYGVLPFFVLTLIYAIFTGRRQLSAVRAGAFVIPAVVMFLICLVVMFAQWDWDNTKIIIWCYLALLPSLWDQLLAKEKFPLRALCCVMLFFSGFISLLGGIDGTHTGFDLASRSELDEVASAVRPLPVTAIFAGCPTYNHPLLLDGRKMVEGYVGHLESHGIDYQKNLDLLESLLNGEAGWQNAARKLHARYLYWGRPEEEAYPDSTKPWEDKCPKVAEGDWGVIYDLGAPAAPDKTAPKP